MSKEAAPNVIGRELFLASLIEDGRHLGSALHSFARRMEEVTFEAGEFVYRLGERSQFFFFLMEGSVTLSKPGAAVHTFGPREVFGLFDATSKEGHAHTAEATKPSRLLRLSVEDWADLLEDNFEMAQRALLRISRQVRALRLRPLPLGGFDDPPAEPPRPKGGLQVVDRILLLREVPTFATASTQALAGLAQLGSTRFAGKDETLFAPGEMQGQLVIVASGEVTVSWEGSPIRARFGPKSLVGGASALSDAPALLVRATSAARAIVLPLEDYFDVMEEHFDLVQSAFAALAAERDLLLDRGV